MSKLPHQDQDPVLTLFAHYYVSADLMLKNLRKTNAKMEKLKNPDRIQWQARVYQFTWLGLLGVTCEGFGKVNPYLTLQNRPDHFKNILFIAERLNKLIKVHHNSLRKFRNSIFHMRDNSDDLADFLIGDPTRIDWAEDLHNLLGEFFSAYRIRCGMTYFLEGRQSEVQDLSGARSRTRRRPDTASN